MSGALSYLGRMLPAMLAVLPLWAAGRGLFLTRRRRPPDWGREALLLALVLWCAGLASQTVLPQGGPAALGAAFSARRTLWRVNLVPFRTIAALFAALRAGETTRFLINFAGNILVFVPLGLLPPLLWRRYRGAGGAALPALCSLGIECCQIFTGRSVDVDDLLLNALGGLLGWLLARAALRKAPC